MPVLAPGLTAVSHIVHRIPGVTWHALVLYEGGVGVIAFPNDLTAICAALAPVPRGDSSVHPPELVGDPRRPRSLPRRPPGMTRGCPSGRAFGHSPGDVEAGGRGGVGES